MSERKVLDRLTLKDNLGERVSATSRVIADSKGVSSKRHKAANDALARKTPVVKVVVRVVRPPPPPVARHSPVACHSWQAALPPLPQTVFPWDVKRPRSPRLPLESQPALQRQETRSIPQPPPPPVRRFNASTSSERPKVMTVARAASRCKPRTQQQVREGRR